MVVQLNTPKSHDRYLQVRTSLKNAAIYAALAEVANDEGQARDFNRLRDLEIAFAKRWSSSAAGDFSLPVNGRFSISLAFYKLASKILSVQWISQSLRGRFRRRLSNERDHFVDSGLRDGAVESMKVLERLSGGEEAEINHIEPGSLATRSGALRATVLGVNDGLVSNTALILGVTAGTSDPGLVLLAGVAGLVGGALSMAAGEYVSVVSQREFNENLVRWERAELALWADEEEAELVEILRAKGLSQEEATSAAARIMSDPDVALDMHVREELGIDPDDLGGSPILAAASSLVAFAGGALVPLLPYIVGMSGTASIVTSALGSGAALLIVGGGLGWLSGNSALYGALRMLVVGFVAGAITFGLGSLVGRQLG